MAYLILAIFLFGLILGSFLNAVIFRLHSGESFLFGRSHCFKCNHELSAADLVPVLSFLWLRGRCRYCRAKLSWQYPVVEILTGALMVLLAIKFQMNFGPEFFISAVFIAFLIVIAVFDLKHYLILDKVVIPFFVLALANSIYQKYFLSSVIGALVIAGFFGLQYLISRGRWIGLGDVKLGLVLGSLGGWMLGVVLIVVAYFAGAAAGLGLILGKKKQLSSRMPFGVFLGSSAIITILYGDKILAWYLKLIGL